MADALRVDVLVVGGGMAGLAAAAEAASAGATVGVVEKARELGGSAAMSAGILWTARDYDELRARMPQGEPDLGRVLTAEFPEAAAQVRATGIEMSSQIDGPYFGFGTGWQIDVRGLFQQWRARIETSGGWIVRGTAARELLTNEDGRVRGARTRGPDGPVDVEADAVVLATGGFQGDPALVAAFIGPHADRLLVRSNPGSVGDGFRMAHSAGASASRSLGGFYGHLLPWPLPDFAERHFLPLTQYHSIHCILVNRFGRRFIDESRGDEYSNQELLNQPEQRAILLADDATRRRYVVTAPYPRGEVVDRFAEAAQAGGNYAQGATLDELVGAVAAWGVPTADLRATLVDYGRAAAGDSVTLDAPLPARPAPLVEPPFHALEVQAAITFPLGGIRVDVDGRALDRDGRPVPGLYACGADAGGVYHQGYGGGLAMSLVFGRRAGQAAAAASAGARKDAGAQTDALSMMGRPS